MRTLTFLIPAAVLCFAPVALAADPAPIEVMIVGDFHMNNPGRDLHNVQVEDVLTPKRQAEIAAAVSGIAQLKPTMVDVEDDAPGASQKYADYLKGTLPPSHSEIVQLGFRLAKQMNLQTVHGIDVEGEFPYDAVDAYAKAHGESAILDAANNDIGKMVDMIGKTLAAGTVSDVLRYLNDSARLSRDNDFYRTTLLVGGGKDQPGAELLTAWYRRNFYICANLVQLAKPGDRVVVFYGSGHAFLLRQCVSEMPGYKLIEPNGYLPK
ncbi:MAG TPA: DUF5694 domain-containing protein [Rhizomicrobium sp.]|jgi:hypothetical protein|nr:DUF5694 domain-containing protein [Rhizomicrobium sp.]